MVRIISGHLGGRVLEVPTQLKLRPTTDRLREAIFSILESRTSLEDCRALDLYAGTGAFGLEVLSRGGAHVTFVESDRAHVEHLKKNICALQVEESSKVFLSTVELFVRKAAGDVGPEPVDIVFIDPPYAEHPGEVLLKELLDVGCVKDGGFVVIESDLLLQMTDRVESDRLALAASLELVRDYGDSRVRLYKVSRAAIKVGS